MNQLTIYHLADLHIRDTDRARLKCATDRLREIIRADTGGPKVMVIAGDIFHYKVRLTAENIEDFNRFVEAMSPVVAALIIIPGNHDANLNNPDRLDLLSPLLEKPPANLFYFPRSGWRTIPSIQARFFVLSPLDKYPAEVPPPPTSPTLTNTPLIAIAHDYIGRSPAEKECIPTKLLAPFDAALLGHIHDYQTIPISGARKAVYSGSLIQLTIGETFHKGFVRWRFPRPNAPHHEFVPITVPGAMVKWIIRAPPGTNEPAAYVNGPEDLVPPSTRVAIVVKPPLRASNPAVIHLLSRIKARSQHADHAPVEPELSLPNEMVADDFFSGPATAGAPGAINVHHSLIEDKLRTISPDIQRPKIDAVLELHKNIIAALPANRAGGARWRLAYLEWSDIFCYGGDNHINFAEISSITGILAHNRHGKSAIIDILMLGLFNDSLRGNCKSIVRRGAKEAHLHVVWLAAAPGSTRASTHEVIRKWDSSGKQLHIRYLINGANKTAETLPATYASISEVVGTPEDFSAAVLISQHGPGDFISLTESRRRAAIARLLGFDVLDAANSASANAARDARIKLRTLAEQLVKIRTDVGVDEDHADELRKRARAAEARINDAKKAMDAFDATIIPADKPPFDSVASIDARINSLKAKIAAANDRLRSITAANEPNQKRDAAILSSADIDATRARITELSARCNPILMAANTSTIVSDLADAERALTTEKMRHALAAEIASLAPIEAKAAALRRDLIIAVGTNADTSAVKSLEELEADYRSLEAQFDPLLPASCIERPSPDDVEQLRRQINAFEQNALASTLVDQRVSAMSPADLEVNYYRACIRVATTYLAPKLIFEDDCPACENNKIALGLNEPPVSGTPISAAHCAIEIERRRTQCTIPSGFVPNDARRKYAAYLYCRENHSKIAVNSSIKARIADCKRAISAATTRAQLAELEPQLARAASAREQLASLPAKAPKTTIEQLQAAVDRFAYLAQNIDAIRAAHSAHDEVVRLQNRLSAHYEACERQANSLRLSEEATRVLKEIATAQIELDDLTSKRPTLEEAIRKYTAYKALLGASQKRRAEYTEQVLKFSGICSTMMTALAQLDRARSIRADMDVLARNIDIHELYQETLDAKSGLQADLFTRALNLIETQTNYILEPVAGLSLHFGSQNLRALVRAGTVEHDAELCSGFQRFALNIAMRRAFLRAAIRPMPQFMIIDEGFGCLDGPNITKICDYLPELAQGLDFMLIISHIDILQTAIQANLTIERADSISRIAHGAPTHAAGPDQFADISRATKKAPPLPDCMSLSGDQVDATCQICGAVVRPSRARAHLNSVRHAKALQQKIAPITDTQTKSQPPPPDRAAGKSAVQCK